MHRQDCDTRAHALRPLYLPELNESSVPPKVLSIGNTSETWLVNDVIRKTYHVDPEDPDITKANIEAAENEANIYMILGKHPLIAECQAIGPAKEFIELRFYSRGSLRDYVSFNILHITDHQLNMWARQLVESVAYIHGKGVRHADLRLDQWLLDDKLCPRLSDFNGSGFDRQPTLGLDSTPATNIEPASHCLPRDFEQDKDSTVKSDLFALGSSLYQLMTDSLPYEDEEDDLIATNFANNVFPKVDHISIGRVIMACWLGHYRSADDILANLADTEPRLND